MSREQMIKHLMQKNPGMSRPQAIYYLEQVLGVL